MYWDTAVELYKIYQNIESARNERVVLNLVIQMRILGINIAVLQYLSR